MSMQSAAPDMYRALTRGSQVNLPDLLDWVADRFVNVYGENPQIDFIQTIRERAKFCRDAIAKAEDRT